MGIRKARSDAGIGKAKEGGSRGLIVLDCICARKKQVEGKDAIRKRKEERKGRSRVPGSRRCCTQHATHTRTRPGKWRSPLSSQPSKLEEAGRASRGKTVSRSCLSRCKAFLPGPAYLSVSGTTTCEFAPKATITESFSWCRYCKHLNSHSAPSTHTQQTHCAV